MSERNARRCLGTRFACCNCVNCCHQGCRQWLPTVPGLQSIIDHDIGLKPDGGLFAQGATSSIDFELQLGCTYLASQSVALEVARGRHSCM